MTSRRKMRAKTFNPMQPGWVGRFRRLARVSGMGLLAAALLPVPPAIAADPIRLVILGDSWTSGYGMESRYGFVPQLETWLNQNGAPDVLVVNAAEAGQTTNGALFGLEARLVEAVALIVQLGGNDSSRTIEKGNSRANLRRILQAARDRDIPVLLIGAFASPEKTEAVRTEFDTMFPDLATEMDMPLYPSFYHVFGRQLDDVPREYLQSDLDHPNQEGVARVVADIGPVVLHFLGTAGLMH